MTDRDGAHHRGPATPVEPPARLNSCCEPHDERLRPLLVRPGDRVLFDMDGTLSDVSMARRWLDPDHPYWRDHPREMPLSREGRFRRSFHRFHREGCEAPFHEDVLDLALAVQDAGGLIEIVTAREDRWRRATEASLAFNGIEAIGVHTRPQGDYRPDLQIKAEILRDLRDDPRPLIAAVDDRPGIAELWHRGDIPALLVPGFVDA